MDRYHRQRLLPVIGDEGQARLSRAHALIVGCGALGCAVADLLARAGVGTLTIVDRDLVELTNLQRQVLFDEAHARAHSPKAVAASERIAQINSGVRTVPVVADFSSANAERILLGDGAAEGRAAGPVGVILDGTDNFETRFLINDLAVKHGVPYAYAGAVGTRAMAATFLPGRVPEGPCLRCVFDGPPPPGSQPTCDTAGVLGPVVSVIAGVQAAEAMKVLVGAHGDVRGTLLEFAAWSSVVRETDLAPTRDPGCPCCAGGSFDYLDAAHADPVAICGSDALQVSPVHADGQRVDLGLLASRLGAHGVFEATRFLIRGSLDREPGLDGAPIGLTVFGDGRALIRGVGDPGRARSIYAKYVGG